MLDRTIQLPAADAPVHHREIRRGVFLAIAVEFVLLMGVAAIQGFWPGGGIGGSTSITILLGMGILVPLIVARMLNRTLARIDAVEAERLRLMDLYGRARHESLVDVLTGLGNHRAFQEELARQLEFSRRHHTPLALLLVDVDELKSVNDARGHVSGDQLLAAVGKVATAAMRRTDRAFRVGGDEFAIVLPGSSVDEGLAVARRILAGALSGGEDPAPRSTRSRCRSVYPPSRPRAPRATSSIGTPMPHSTGASAMDGRPRSFTTPAAMGERPMTGRWRTSRLRSRASWRAAS